MDIQEQLSKWEAFPDLLNIWLSIKMPFDADQDFVTISQDAAGGILTSVLSVRNELANLRDENAALKAIIALPGVGG